MVVILSEDIYNFDKTDFAIDLTAIAKIIIYTDCIDQIYIRINYINKFDLITIYSIAQTEVLICQNIQNSFTATELVLYKSEKMLSKLDIHPPNSLNQTINRILKIYKITINSTILLENKAHKLHTAYKKQKQKCTQSHRRIPIEEGITVGELQEIVQPPVEAEETPIPPSAAQTEASILPTQPTRRRLPMCKKCGNEEHRSNHCPTR
ncbi:hypothetical protein VI817_009980 [Penicillium citrinum]|nr:hypothetical protein VI817_009980 [Penicillium citrinum]